MKRPLVFGLAFGLASFLSLGHAAWAQSGELQWDLLSPEEREIVDRIAADFFENELRKAQSDTIESHTSEIYAQLSPEEREAFREERLHEWQAFDEFERASLRNAKEPRYLNLTEGQKAPFRQHAFDKLGGAGAVNRDALADALRNDI